MNSYQKRVVAEVIAARIRDCEWKRPKLRYEPAASVVQAAEKAAIAHEAKLDAELASRFTPQQIRAALKLLRKDQQ